MKDPRTWNRRDSAVTPNGFFTILKTTGRVSRSASAGGIPLSFLASPSGPRLRRRRRIRQQRPRLRRHPRRGGRLQTMPAARKRQSYRRA